MSWEYLHGTEYRPVTSTIIGNHSAFIYLITNRRSLHKYIGAKNIGKGEDWIPYWSSCIPLREEISLGSTRYWSREILQLYRTGREAFAAETSLQTALKVLHMKHKGHGGHLFYNGCVGENYIKRQLQGVGEVWGSPEDRETHNQKWRDRIQKALSAR